MAGLDGIKNKIHPGEAMDKDLYALSEEELKGVPYGLWKSQRSFECFGFRQRFP